MVKQPLHQSVGGYCLACWRTLLLYSAGSCKVRALLLNTEIRYGMDQIKADNRGIEINKKKNLDKKLIAVSLCRIRRIWLIKQILNAN